MSKTSEGVSFFTENFPVEFNVPFDFQRKEFFLPMESSPGIIEIWKVTADF